MTIYARDRISATLEEYANAAGFITVRFNVLQDTIWTVRAIRRKGAAVRSTIIHKC